MINIIRSTTKSSCFNCLEEVLINASQCTACNAPVITFAEDDLYPMQFINYAYNKGLKIPQLIQFSLTRLVQIVFDHKIVESEDFLRAIAFFKNQPPIEAYTRLLYDIPNAEPRTVGISQEVCAEKYKKDLALIRQYLFAPIVVSLENAKKEFIFLDKEISYLQTFIILKSDIEKKFRTMIQSEVFEFILAASKRETVKTYLNSDYLKIQDSKSENDHYSILNLLIKHSFFQATTDFAKQFLFLFTGQGYDLFLESVENMFLTSETITDLNGYVCTMPRHVLYIECCLQIFSWRTFQLDPKEIIQKPARLKVEMNVLAKTIALLKMQGTELEHWSILGKLALKEKLTNEEVDLIDHISARDSNFAMTRILISQRLNKTLLENNISENSEFESIAWILGLNQKIQNIPLLSEESLSADNLQALTEILQKKIDLVKHSKKLEITSENINDLVRHFIIQPKEAPSWELTPEDESGDLRTLKNNALNLIIFHTDNHDFLCEALRNLTTPPELFWFRKNILLDSNLLKSLLSQEGWIYRPQSLFDLLNSFQMKFQGLGPYDRLDVESSFLPKILDWQVNEKKNTQGLLSFFNLIAKVQINNPSEDLYQTIFALRLIHLSQFPNFMAGTVVEELSTISSKRKELFPHAPLLGDVLLESYKGWEEGVSQIVDLSTRRLSETQAIPLLSFLRDEKVFDALVMSMDLEKLRAKMMRWLMALDFNEYQIFSMILACCPPYATFTKEQKEQFYWRMTSSQFITNDKITAAISKFIG